MKSSSRLLALLIGAAAVNGCGGDGTGPPAGSYSVAVYEGDGQFGTSGATLAEPLRVVVADPSSKKAKTGVQVTWRIVEGNGAVLNATTSTTNAQGIANTTLRLGEQLGTYRVEAATEKTAGSPASFTARAVAVPAIASVAPTSANAGETVTITGQNFSTTADDNVVSFDGFRGRVVSATATELRAVIPTCVPSRTVNVRVSLGAVSGNQQSISVNGNTAGALQLARGEAITLASAADLACFRLPSAATGATYLVVPQNFSEIVSSLSAIEVAALLPGSTTMAVTEKPLASLSVAEDWEWRLRKQERALLGSPDAALRPQSSVTAAACPSPATPGGRCDFQVLDKENKFQKVTAEVKAVSTRAVVYQDINAPANGLTNADFVALGAVFDDPIYETDVATFGTPTDLDANGKVIILLTPVVNALTERGSSGFVAGFFYGCDLLRRSACSGSNEAEIFYALTADPTGQFSDARSRDAVIRSMPPVLAHEFQHMINFGQRKNNTIDALWLSEGMAHHAEDVVGDVYEARRDFVNADLFKRQNTSRADRFLRASASTSLIADEDVGSLELRGAAWLLVKYLHTQYGNDILIRLTRSTATGVANVAAETGKPWRTLLADWGVALWADDAPDLLGVTIRRELTFPDFNLRQRISGASTYALRPSVYSFQDLIHRETLLASSQAYLLLQGGSTSQPLSLTYAGKYGGAFAAGAAPQVTILRVK